MHPRHRLLPLFAVVLVCAIAAPAAAQDRRRVTVLAMDADAAFVDAATALYAAVRTQVAYHRDLALNDVPPQSYDDLLLAVGCSELDADCAELVQMVIDADWLVWGEVDETGAHVIAYDVTNARTLREARLERAPSDWRERDDVLLARQLLWGPVGALTVRSEPTAATVYLDDALIGVTPIDAATLPLGTAVLRVERPGHQPHEEVVEIDLGEAVVDVELVSTDVVAQVPRSPRNGAAAAWTTVGVGAVLAGAGLVTGIESRQNQRAFDRAVDDVELDRDRAEELRDRGTRQSRAANILLPVGGTTLIGGIVWALVQRSGDERVADFAQGRVRF